MHAALVTEYTTVPRFTEVAEPVVTDAAPEVVEVVAAALHPRVRSQADGSHYTSTDDLPLIPGIDAVGRRADGSLAYFLLSDTQFGTMAERVAIDPRRSIPLPEGTDPIAVAAAMNPAMSSWIALKFRTPMQAGASVLVLGATGSAGQLAVQVAKHLGAGTVIAAGRDQATLDSLSQADELISIAGDPIEAAERVGHAAADVDIVLDYLWGEPAELTIPALLRQRADASTLLTWVQIGSITGADISIASALFRGANFSLVGSGQGSVSTRGILSELPALAAEVSAGSFAIDTDVRDLSTVEEVWSAPSDARRRVVFVPNPHPQL